MLYTTAVRSARLPDLPAVPRQPFPFWAKARTGTL